MAAAFLELIQEEKTPSFQKVPINLHETLKECLKFNPDERGNIHSLVKAYTSLMK